MTLAKYGIRYEEWSDEQLHEFAAPRVSRRYDSATSVRRSDELYEFTKGEALADAVHFIEQCLDNAFLDISDRQRKDSNDKFKELEEKRMARKGYIIERTAE